MVAFVKGTRTTPQCGFSHKVLSILNELRVDYEVVDVLDDVHNPGLREAIKTFSQWPTIPQVRQRPQSLPFTVLLGSTGQIQACGGINCSNTVFSCAQ